MRTRRFEKEDDSVKETGLHNICGVLIHAETARAGRVGEALSGLPGVEIHHQTEDGRLIVVVEDTENTSAARTMASFTQVEGVLSTALVYHQFEDADAMEEEVVVQ